MKLTINHLSYDDRLDNNLEKIASRLIKGEELTVNESKRTAFIGQYHGVQQGVPFEWVDVLIASGFIGCDSGNFETGDRHYTFLARPDIKENTKI